MNDDLTARISEHLRRGPATAREIADAIGSTRKEVNSTLYRRGDLFDRNQGETPTWQAHAVEADDTVHNPSSTRSPKRSMNTTPRSKKDALAEILAAVGSPADLVLGPGSTEPKALFLEVNRHLDLGLDESLSKVALARLITGYADLRWPDGGDSEDSPSGGGDTVTLTGLQTVLAAVRLIAAAGPVERTISNPPPLPPGEYREATGGIDAPPRELLEDWNSLDSATRRHAELQNRIAAEVWAAGLTPLSPTATQPQFDIAWEAAGRFVVCEVKSSDADNAVQQVRLGLGQVLEYRRELADEHPTVVAAVACETPPSHATRRGLSAVGVRLICSESLRPDLVPLL